MPASDPQDPDLESAVRESLGDLARQTIGTTLEHVTADEVQIVLPFRSDLPRSRIGSLR